MQPTPDSYDPYDWEPEHDDEVYLRTIRGLEISSTEIFRALSIYYDFRASGFKPQQCYELGVEKYMEDGQIPIPETTADL